jgi:hypothetical protein
MTIEFEGYIAECDDPEYVAKQMMRYAKQWICETRHEECKLTKKVRATLKLEVLNDQ